MPSRPRTYTAEQIEARRVRCRAWYYANRDHARASYRARVQRAKAIINAAKDRPCVDCGVKYPLPAMHLDHVRGHKHLPLARMKSYSEARICAEIAKCEVRCANCHAVKTWGDPSHKETN